MALILNLDNQNAEFYYNLALDQLEKGINYEAILNLIKANELSDDPTYKLQLAEAYYNTQNFIQSTNIYIKLFFENRKLAYVLAIYRNLLLMGRTLDARRFILNCFRNFENILTDEFDDIPEMDENELQQVMGLVETDDFNGYFNISEEYSESIINRLRGYVAKSNFDDAIMEAMEIKPDSKLYDSAQEIICIAAHARGDYDLAEKTARALFARVPSAIAFGVLAVMPTRVSRKEIESKASSLAAFIKNRSDKALDFLKTLAHSEHKNLFEKYLEEIYMENPCMFDIIAYKMFSRFSEGKIEEGKSCLKRLQMLFPNDFRVRSYIALLDAQSPASCWEELKFVNFCTDIDSITNRFYDIEYNYDDKKKAAEDIKNMICALLIGQNLEDVSLIIDTTLSVHSPIHSSLTKFFESLLSDINILPENKCDLIYGMLMYGWNSFVDIMMGDTFVQCRLASLSISKLPIKLARMYCEIYVQMISDGEEPHPEQLLDVIQQMNILGIKNGMKQEALLAVAHYIYEKRISIHDESLEDYIEIYYANPTTAYRYYEIYKGITE